MRARRWIIVDGLDGSGKRMGAPTVVSVRTMSQGGIAIAPGAQGTRDAAIAWVARDAGDPQVFVTRINSEARRDNQQMLTRIKGDAADAAIAWAMPSSLIVPSAFALASAG